MENDRVNAFLEAYNALCNQHGLCLARDYDFMLVHAVKGESKLAQYAPDYDDPNRVIVFDVKNDWGRD
jgi:hypothetical protein